MQYSSDVREPLWLPRRCPDVRYHLQACLVQANLGAVNAAADLQAACSGFAYGLVTAASYINTGIYKNVLVIGGEVLSRILNWKDQVLKR